MNNLLKKFGMELRKLRLEQGLSQEEFGKRAGLHRTYIGMLERGEKNVTLLNLYKIAKVLKVSVGSLTNLNEK